MIRRPPISTLFPYTTSSDLGDRQRSRVAGKLEAPTPHEPERQQTRDDRDGQRRQSRAGDQPVIERVRDRKSTRLNSSHRCISYAVFCLKKKKNNKMGHRV